MLELIDIYMCILYRFPPTVEELARDEAHFRAELKKMTERERSKSLFLSVNYMTLYNIQSSW